MSNILQLIGAKVREYRKNKGWSQEQLSEYAGFHYSFIGGVERGERNISLKNLERIAASLEVEIYELFAFKMSVPAEIDTDPLLQEILEMLLKMNQADLKRLKVVIKEFLN